jgi:predicted transcriptional regulator
MIGARVPIEVKQQVDRFAESSNITSSRVVELAIASFLDIDTQDSPTARIDQHTAAIKQLSKQMAELTESIRQLQQWRERLKRRGF